MYQYFFKAETVIFYFGESEFSKLLIEALKYIQCILFAVLSVLILLLTVTKQKKKKEKVSIFHTTDSQHRKEKLDIILKVKSLGCDRRPLLFICILYTHWNVVQYITEVCWVLLLSACCFFSFFFLTPISLGLSSPFLGTQWCRYLYWDLPLLILSQ